MDGESKIRPILGHLTWLAERIADPVNNGRLSDAALLTYNAAVMLQWRFVAPVSNADIIQREPDRVGAAEVIDGLVTSVERVVAKAEDAEGDQDTRLRAQLVTSIKKSLRELQRLLILGESIPTRVPDLESSPNVRGLLDEFLAAHAEQHAAAIEEGRLAAVKEEVGPDAALKEAIAGLIYIHDDAREAEMSPKLRRQLTQMAAGFFKTAVEQQADGGLPLVPRRTLIRLAGALVESAASANP